MSNIHTITIKLTFDGSNCIDVDEDGYDPEPDLEEIIKFGREYYNLQDVEVVPDAT